MLLLWEGLEAFDTHATPQSIKDCIFVTNYAIATARTGGLSHTHHATLRLKAKKACIFVSNYAIATTRTEGLSQTRHATPHHTAKRLVSLLPTMLFLRQGLKAFLTHMPRQNTSRHATSRPTIDRISIAHSKDTKTHVCGVVWRDRVAKMWTGP